MRVLSIFLVVLLVGCHPHSHNDDDNDGGNGGQSGGSALSKLEGVWLSDVCAPLRQGKINGDYVKVSLSFVPVQQLKIDYRVFDNSNCAGQATESFNDQTRVIDATLHAGIGFMVDFNPDGITRMVGSFRGTNQFEIDWMSADLPIRRYNEHRPLYQKQ